MCWLERLRGSLRGRLVINLSAALALCLGAFTAGFDLMIDREISNRFDHSMVDRARALGARFAQRATGTAAAPVPVEAASGVHQEMYKVWDRSGRALARSETGDLDLAPPANAGAGPVFFDLRLPDGREGRAVSMAFDLPPADPRGRLLVTLAESSAERDALEIRLHLLLLTAAGITLAVILALAWLTVDRGLKPVRVLAREIARIDPDQAPPDFDMRALPVELQPVTQKFASLIRRLYHALSSERRFARNIAHELRTPLAEMRMTAEVGALDDTVAGLRAHLDVVGGAAQQMESIVNVLLMLARYDAGLEKPAREPVNLAELVARHLHRLEPQIAGRRLQVTGARVPELWVQADPVLADSVCKNLLENALEYAPAGTAVEIALGGDRLRVRNAAPSLSADDVAQLGEPFAGARGPQAGAASPHLGAGLALVAAVARVHGWTVSHRLEPDQRLCTTVSGFQPLMSVDAEKQPPVP